MTEASTEEKRNTEDKVDERNSEAAQWTGNPGRRCCDGNGSARHSRTEGRRCMQDLLNSKNAGHDLKGERKKKKKVAAL